MPKFPFKIFFKVRCSLFDLQGAEGMSERSGSNVITLDDHDKQRPRSMSWRAYVKVFWT